MALCVAHAAAFLHCSVGCTHEYGYVVVDTALLPSRVALEHSTRVALPTVCGPDNGKDTERGEGVGGGGVGRRKNACMYMLVGVWVSVGVWVRGRCSSRQGLLTNCRRKIRVGLQSSHKAVGGRGRGKRLGKRRGMRRGGGARRRRDAEGRTGAHRPETRASEAN